MRFYRANILNSKYVKAAPVQSITYKIASIITRNKSGDAVAYQGKFTSTESIKSGALVIGEENGLMQPYKVERQGGMSGIYTYMLSEEGFIKGANG